MNNFQPTAYEDLNLVLIELVKSAKETLQDNFIGAYLQGSFAIGDFDEHSDVDFVIVINEEISASQIELLQEMHEKIYQLDYAWAQHLEGSYFPKRILRSDSCDDFLWYLDHGSQTPKKSKHDNTLVVRSVLYRCGVPLVGPPIRSLVNAVPVEKLRQEILNGSMNWGNHILANPEEIGSHYYQAFAVLHFCRVIYSLHTGRIDSKLTGAEWFKENIDSTWNDLIDRAWSGRPRPEITSRTPADPDELSLTIDFVRHIMVLLTRKRDTLESA